METHQPPPPPPEQPAPEQPAPPAEEGQGDEQEQELQDFSRATELEPDQPEPALFSDRTSIPKEINVLAPGAVRESLRKWNVTGDVTSLVHGRFEGVPASLVVFRFRFRFDAAGSSSRLARADISLQVQPADGAPASAVPAIRQFAPRLVHSSIGRTHVAHSQSLGANVGAGSGVQAGVEGSLHRETAFERETRTQVLGQAWTSDEAYAAGVETDDAVSWTLTENKQQADGIPRELAAAVLLARPASAAVQATVQVKCKTAAGFGLFGWPWSRPRPLVLRDSVAFGLQLPRPALDALDALDEAQWEALVGIDRPYSRIRVTERHKERSCA